jgi:serine/threonine protein kinase
VNLTPGTTIGAYRIVEQIGRGGMATVYKAHQAALARYVAIKVLPEFLAGEPGFKERFQQEAVSVAKLRHPNILSVFDYGNQDGTAYIVTEFVDGGTLSDQLGSPLPLDYVVATLRPIASALDYAHARGILHRDIKPSNILLNMEGTPVLGDFGLAKMMESGPGLTQSGMVLGTPEYMSPEQCAGEGVGPAADTYSLGVVAYQMLTGELPFQAATPAAVLHAQVNNRLPPPRSVNPNLSEQVEGVLLKALAKAPADRYRSGNALVRALEDAEAGAPPVGQPAAQASPAAAATIAATPRTTSPATPAPPSPAAAPAGRGPVTPVWVGVVLALGAVMTFVWAMIILANTGEPSAQGRAKGVLVIWAFLSLASSLLGVGSLVGAVMRAGWGRSLAWVSSVAMTLTCFGALMGVPALVGLWSSRKQATP